MIVGEPLSIWTSSFINGGSSRIQRGEAESVRDARASGSRSLQIPTDTGPGSGGSMFNPVKIDFAPRVSFVDQVRRFVVSL